MSGHQEDKRQLALKTLALFKKMLCEMDYTNAAGTRIEDFEAVGDPGPKAIGVPDARGDPEPKAERVTETLELSLAAVRLAFGQWPDTRVRRARLQSGWWRRRHALTSTFGWP